MRPRTTTRRVVVALLVLALLTGAVSAVAGASDRPASEPSAAAALEPVDGYPERIGFARPAPRLPDRPGPLAATMTDNDFGAAHDVGVTSRGRLWALPRGVNALSPDGRLLLTSRGTGAQARAAVHDLSTGEVQVYDDIGDRYDAGQAVAFDYSLDAYEPVHWSADASAVLARFDELRRWRPPRAMVLDVGSGELTLLPDGEPAGFRSPTRPVVVRWSDDDPIGPVAVTTDLDTGETDELPLRPSSTWDGAGSPASVSPDGSTLLLVEAPRGSLSAVTLRLFSLDDGAELPPRRVDDWDGCSPTWRGGDPVVPTRSEVAGTALVTADGAEPLVAVHHRMQSMCLELTEDALGAGPHRALFGTSTVLWTWYWWQLLGLLALGLLALAVLLRILSSRGRARRMSRAPAHRAGRTPPPRSARDGGTVTTGRAPPPTRARCPRPPPSRARRRSSASGRGTRGTP